MDHPRDPGAGADSALRRSAARLRRFLRPPRTLRPTRAGWLFFALTLGVGFAALNTGNNLLYLVISFMLAFLVLSGVLSESALRGVRVRRISIAEAYAGRPTPVVLEIENRARRAPAFALAVEDVLGAGWSLRTSRAAGRVFALRIGPGCRERRVYRFSAPRRGWLDFQGFRVATRFPFGLFSKSLVLERPDRVLVYPRIEAIAAIDLGAAADPRETATSGPGRAGADASGLREFSPGDSFRRIHWRATARRGALVVREVESEADAEIVLPLQTRGATPGDRFERAVERTASKVVALCDAGFRVGLVTDAERLAPASGPRQRTRLLAFLALVAPDPARADRADPGPGDAPERRLAMARGA